MDWIKTSDRLPERNIKCLVIYDGKITIAEFERHNFGGGHSWEDIDYNKYEKGINPDCWIYLNDLQNTDKE